MKVESDYLIYCDESCPIIRITENDKECGECFIDGGDVVDFLAIS